MRFCAPTATKILAFGLLANKEAVMQFDEADHGLLTDDDIPWPNYAGRGFIVRWC
jgi:hypothetical protein